jgi:hypothetical protein
VPPERTAAGPDRAPTAAIEGAQGAGERPRRPVSTATRAVLAVLVALLAVELAVIEAFLVPLRIRTVPLPVCVPLGVIGNVLLARLAGRVSGRPVVAVVPPVLWLVVVLLLAAPRAEGDVVVPGTLTGLVFLFAGCVAGAYGAASSLARRRARSRPPTRG